MVRDVCIAFVYERMGVNILNLVGMVSVSDWTVFAWQWLWCLFILDMFRDESSLVMHDYRVFSCIEMDIGIL